MAVNSPQPTLLCVITLCVCLSRLYDQDFPFLDFFVLSVVVVILPTRTFLGREVGRIWRLDTDTERGQRRWRSSQRCWSGREPSPPPLNHMGGLLAKFRSHPSTTHISNQRGEWPMKKILAHPGSLGEGGLLERSDWPWNPPKNTRTHTHPRRWPLA